jgi:hypothetical protein
MPAPHTIRSGRRHQGRPSPALVVLGPEPAEEQLMAMTRTLACVLGTLFAAAAGLSLAGLAGTVAGWILLALAGGAGLAPAAWYRRRGRRPGRLSLRELDPRAARLVVNAAAEAEVLRQLANRAPGGPVADHLHHLAATAGDYVLALHQAARQQAGAGRTLPDPELQAAMTRITAQLADLSAAAGRLREAQRHHLQSSMLEELTEATDQLTAAVESGQLG